ncbi:reverse transcriptase [Gossypium australe]|uniref:Reverse transcriptase n=1 Tax=Gossypium australe TaxID=47621 RepID=A0A5B6X385_9ROSI|nr:reverse transcriptase [Gossypium australe]
MGFATQWIDKIMGCVRSVKYLIKGLRQGDPLSPYLFLLCMEAFSRMLIQAQNNDWIRGIRASVHGPGINHLFFADDALLFVRNKKGN